MRRSRFPVTILAACLVVLVTTASLLIAGLATYFTVRNGQQHGLPVDYRDSLYQPFSAALLIGLLLSAVLCTLLWRTFLHHLRALDAARQKSESMLSTVLDAVPYWIWWKDRDGVFLGCNREFVAAAGCQDPGQILGKTDFDLPWPHDESVAYRADDRAVLASNQSRRHIAEPLTCATGEVRWVDTTKVPLRDADGAPYGVLGVAEDVTERKDAEDALRHEKALIDAIFDNIPGVIHLYDDQGRLVRWNAAATQLTGFSGDDLMLRTVAEGRTGGDRDQVRDAFLRAIRDGRATVETHLYTRDGGHAIPIFITGVRVTFGGRPHVLAIGIDITDRKRAEEALLREKAVTDAVFDNAPTLFAIYDGAGRLIRWNQKTNEITGYSDAELATMTVGDRQPPEERERIIADVQQVMQEGHQIAQEATLLTKQGGRLPYYFNGVRVMLDGKPHLLSIGVDIRERKLAEEQLRRALEQAESANRAKDHFLAAISHELRTPLAPVLFLSSSLESDPRLPIDARSDLADIREHAEIEKRLIGDLLDFSAIHAGKLQIHPVPTDVHDVLRAAIRTCQDGIDRKHLRLHVCLEARHYHTHGDPGRLRQVFWNLIQNACKFTPDDCDISVRTRDDDEGLTLRIEVADTGMGMTPETLQRVFRPFEQGPRDQRTQHVGGLGLGLAISRSIVDAHGGSVTATSDGPGRGSAFVVRLPVTAKAPSVTLPVTPNVPPADRQSLRLLLVEDHPLTLKLLGRLLSAEGHEVTTATTIEAALRAADERPFDLVLSDLTLPDGSGLNLMPLLRDRHHLPGIALSGYGSDEDRDRSRRAGFLAHLTKPVTPESLRSALAQFTSSAYHAVP